MLVCEVCQYGYIEGDIIECSQGCDIAKAEDCAAFEVEGNFLPDTKAIL